MDSPFFPSSQTFKANGKLLLSAEYFVLDGALALALPTLPGQQLTITREKGMEGILQWQSKDKDGRIWFEAKFSTSGFGVIEKTDEAIAGRLKEIFQSARQVNPDFLVSRQNRSVVTNLDFPKAWGLGTSSTLVYNIASWAKIDPYQLLANTFGGSGYDIACAGANGPISYRLQEGRPIVEAASFHPPFSNHLYFVYLGHKQNSREGIAHYRKRVKAQPALIKEISALTEAMLSCDQLFEFEELIRQHEKIIGESLQLPRAKELYFGGFPGEIKSLGAWGGDFVLVTSKQETAKVRQYFNEKGYEVFLRYGELIREEKADHM